MNLSEIQFLSAKIVQTVGGNTLTQALDEAGQAPGGCLGLVWNRLSGGTLNPSTNAMVGATETVLSGTLVAVAVEENVRSVLRQYSEIVAGDLVVTLTGDPQVVLGQGQPLSGTLPLSGVAAFGPLFYWNGNQYSQKAVSEDLRSLWNESVAGVVLTRGILLRRNT